MVPNKIKVEVAYATPSQQEIIMMDIAPDATIQEAILQSGILSHFPEIDLSKQKVGIFGKQRLLSGTVKAGDRIEIYRPLTIDPKEARRAKGRPLKKKKS